MTTLRTHSTLPHSVPEVPTIIDIRRRFALYSAAHREREYLLATSKARAAFERLNTPQRTWGEFWARKPGMPFLDREALPSPNKGTPAITYRDMVLKIVHNGALCTEDFARELGLHAEEAFGVMERLIQAGCIRELGRNGRPFFVEATLLGLMVAESAELCSPCV